jgi:DNA-binding transcriptional MerR regulator
VKSGELAARLGVSDSLIRKWSGQYARFLSPRAGSPQAGQDREFNEADQLLMSSIAHLRDDGKSHDEIEQTIDEGWRVEHLPAAPDPQTEELRSKVALVPVDRLHRALDRVQVLEDEITRMARERDEARQGEKQSAERIADLREQLAEARTKAEFLERMLEEEKKRKRGFFGR